MPAASDAKTSANPSQTTFHLQQAFKLALSMVLFYGLALWTNWDEPKYGALAIVIISLGTTGASVEQGILRFVGTTFGVAVGYLILGLFNHDRWATMLAFAVHITGIGYFMQASRFPYAWYVAAFVPLVVWGDNYPHFDSAFYFGTFRWLETTVGVLIYTLVDLVFWPRRAGDQLNPLVRDLWAELREHFGNYRGHLEQGELPQGASDLQSKVAGTLSRTISILQDAYFDSPEVRRQKRLWKEWRVNARGLVDALELWGEIIDEGRQLDLDQLLPGLGPGLDTLEKRLDRIGVLWETRQALNDVPDTDDGPLIEKLALDLDRSACADLAHFDRATLMSFLGHLESLDRSSRELLRTMRVLAGLEASRDFPISPPPQDRFQLSAWDPGRLIHALFPPAAFITAFYFWVFIYPPPGSKVPMFAAILALIVLRTSFNPWMGMFLSTLFAVAPVYWLVMPALSTSFGLLSLIFIYSFVFGYLGGRSPSLKSGPMIMFAVTTGISNQQSYSFQGPVDGALMILLAGGIMTVVYYFFIPMRAEQALLRSLRRFFHGCARVTGGYAFVGTPARGRRVRNRYFESMVRPAPAMIQTAQRNLDYRLYPDNSPDKVQRLHDSMQFIVYRMESLQVAHDRIASRSFEFPKPLIPVGRQISEIVQLVFEQWANLEPGDAFEAHRGSLEQLSRDVQQQFDELETGWDGDSISDRVLTDLYTMLGSVRGLLAAMANAQGVINQMNWPQWATARF